jgi:prepilin-type processing-associated H-X9-DG protein
VFVGFAFPNLYKAAMTGASSGTPEASDRALAGLAILADVLTADANGRRHKTGVNVIYADGSGKYVLTDAFRANLAIMIANAGTNPLGQNASATYDNAVCNPSAKPPTGVWYDFDQAPQGFSPLPGVVTHPQYLLGICRCAQAKPADARGLVFRGENATYRRSLR